MALAVGLRRVLTGSATPGDTRFRRLDLYALACLAAADDGCWRPPPAGCHQQAASPSRRATNAGEAVQPPLPTPTRSSTESLFNHVMSGKTIHARRR